MLDDGAEKGVVQVRLALVHLCEGGELAGFFRGMRKWVLDAGLFLGESRVPIVVFIDQEVRRIE